MLDRIGYTILGFTMRRSFSRYQILDPLHRLRMNGKSNFGCFKGGCKKFLVGLYKIEFTILEFTMRKSFSRNQISDPLHLFWMNDKSNFGCFVTKNFLIYSGNINFWNFLGELGRIGYRILGYTMCRSFSRNQISGPLHLFWMNGNLYKNK